MKGTIVDMIINFLTLFVLWYAVIRVFLMQFHEYKSEYDKWILKRRTIKKLKINIKAWTNIAKRYDPVTEASNRGLAVARVLNLQHELDRLTH